MNISGAADMLDGIEPGWFNRIDPEYLNMHNPDKCILGQVFSHRIDDPSNNYPDTGYVWALENIPVIGEAFFSEFGSGANLSEWIEEINKRRQNTTSNRVARPGEFTLSREAAIALLLDRDPAAAINEIIKQISG